MNNYLPDKNLDINSIRIFLHEYLRRSKITISLYLKRHKNLNEIDPESGDPYKDWYVRLLHEKHTIENLLWDLAGIEKYKTSKREVIENESLKNQ